MLAKYLSVSWRVFVWVYKKILPDFSINDTFVLSYLAIPLMVWIRCVIWMKKIKIRFLRSSMFPSRIQRNRKILLILTHVDHLRLISRKRLERWSYITDHAGSTFPRVYYTKNIFRSIREWMVIIIHNNAHAITGFEGLSIFRIVFMIKPQTSIWNSNENETFI